MSSSRRIFTLIKEREKNYYVIYIYMNLNTVFFCDFIVHCGKLVNHLRLSFASRQLFRSNVYKSYGYVHSLFIENVGLTAFIDIVIPIK